MVVSNASAEVADRIIAVVNRTVITELQLREVERQFASQRGDNAIPEEERQKLLDALIENELIRQQANEAGILVNDEELQAALYDLKKRSNFFSDEQLKAAVLQEGKTWDEFLDEIRAQIKMAKLVNREVRSKIKVSTEEVQVYYQQNPQQFAQESPTVFIRHILLAVTDDADVQAVREQADMLVQQLRQGADFAAFARQYSEHPSAENGGELGTFKEGDLAAPFDVAVHMTAGDISDPIRSEFGFHIIFVEKKTGGKEASFEKAQSAIRRRLFEQKTAELYQTWIEQVKERAYIEKK